MKQPSPQPAPRDETTSTSNPRGTIDFPVQKYAQRILPGSGGR